MVLSISAPGPRHGVCKVPKHHYTYLNQILSCQLVHDLGFIHTPDRCENSFFKVTAGDYSSVGMFFFETKARWVALHIYKTHTLPRSGWPPVGPIHTRTSMGYAFILPLSRPCRRAERFIRVRAM